MRISGFRKDPIRIRLNLESFLSMNQCSHRTHKVIVSIFLLKHLIDSVKSWHKLMQNECDTVMQTIQLFFSTDSVC